MRKHYHAMSGSIGCLPDNNEVFTSRKEAIRYLCELFDGERGLYTDLTILGVHYFRDPRISGAAYAEVSMPCNDIGCSEEV